MVLKYNFFLTSEIINRYPFKKSRNIHHINVPLSLQPNRIKKVYFFMSIWTTFNLIDSQHQFLCLSIIKLNIGCVSDTVNTWNEYSYVLLNNFSFDDYVFPLQNWKYDPQYLFLPSTNNNKAIQILIILPIQEL